MPYFLTDFRSAVQAYCDTRAWKLSEVDDRHAVLKFAMPSGRSQILYILKYEDVIEFSVPSLAAYEQEEELPHYLSSILMKMNAKNKIGFWCIEQIGTRFVYSYMHNAELASINEDNFLKIVETVVTQTDNFEGTLLKVMNE
jgi:hypothetical protein